MRWWKLNHTECRISTPLLFFFFPCGFKEIHALKYVIGAGTGQWSLVIICYCVLPSRLPGPLGLPATSATSTLIAAQGKTFCCSQRNMEGHTDSVHVPQSCATLLSLWGIYSFQSSEMWKDMSRKQAESSSWAEPLQS